MSERRKVQRNGHSLCVNLIPAHCRALDLKDGSYVEMDLSVQRRILISPERDKVKGR